MYEAANLLNPIYQLITTGDACLQANGGSIDPRAAARACTELTVTAGTFKGGRALRGLENWLKAKPASVGL